MTEHSTPLMLSLFSLVAHDLFSQVDARVEWTHDAVKSSYLQKSLFTVSPMCMLQTYKNTKIQMVDKQTPKKPDSELTKQTVIKKIKNKKNKLGKVIKTVCKNTKIQKYKNKNTKILPEYTSQYCGVHSGFPQLPYSGKIWRALNLAISAKTPYF